VNPSPASLPGAARAEPHRPRRSPSLTAPPASPPLERATGCPRGRKDGGGGAFFPFPPSSPALFPLQWCCCERRGPIRRWLAWPFLRQRGRIRVLVGRIQSPVARSGGRRARLPTSSGGWDAVVVWSAVGAAWVLSSCPLPCSGGKGRRGGAAVGLASVQMFSAAMWPWPSVQCARRRWLAIGAVGAEAVVVWLRQRRRGGVAGRGLARFAPAAPWWRWLAAAWCWHARNAVVARLAVPGQGEVADPPPPLLDLAVLGPELLWCNLSTVVVPWGRCLSIRRLGARSGGLLERSSGSLPDPAGSPCVRGGGSSLGAGNDAGA